jgi:hypothetical protein
MFDLPKLDLILTAEDFEPWVGRAVTVAADPEPVAIQLLRVVRKPASPIALRMPFSLIFGSTPDILLVDGTYSMKCGSRGPYEIFMVPIVSPPGQRLYEAVFN